MTAGSLHRGGRIDAAVAAGAYEVVALRLALGVLAALRELRLTAGDVREEMLALVDEPGSGR